MEIEIQHNLDGLKKVSVFGEIEIEDDVETIMELLNVGEEEKIQIIFNDATVIKKAIIDKLYLLQRKNQTIVQVCKQYLFTYLFKLGIRCKLISKEKISGNKRNNQYCKDFQFNKVEVKHFLEEIFHCYGYDYTNYQVESIMRRIKISMVRQGISNFNLFKESVLMDEGLFEQLFIDFSINTTEFFRDPVVFAEIREKLLPYLNSYAHIKVWCAGCSTGQEPYSLAMALHEMDMLDKVQIYATDINPYVIQEAKNGLYPLMGLENHIQNYRRAKGNKSFMKYFKMNGEYMEISELLKKNILFFQHSLIGSGILNEFQLILCRNVLIYIEPILQKNILENFYHSLDWNGFLVLGKSEGIINNEGSDYFYSYQNPESKIFKRK